MIYHHLFKNANKEKVTVAVIGTGHFGKAIVTQQKYNQYLSIRIVMDKDLESAKNALLDAEIDNTLIGYAGNINEAKQLLQENKYIFTDSLDVVLGLEEVDIICEGTGVPEAGAFHVLKAIEFGKHVAMISKEPDSAVGPILRKIAQDAGVVYTPVDGDQHGLLISLYEWAKEVGLTVISGGKSRDGEFIFDEENKLVTIYADGITVHETQTVTVADQDLKYFKTIPEGQTVDYVEKRATILKDLTGAGAFDLCELTIMANATQLEPSPNGTYSASLRIRDLPIAYCNKEDGGLFENKETIDLITCLRGIDEGGMGGGVFLVVKCDNAYSNYILTTKGQIANYDNSAAVIYRPYHLCGVETSISLACAGLLGLDTGSLEYRPKYDLIKYATQDIKAGEELGNDHDLRMRAELAPAQIKKPHHAIPGHLITGNKAKVDIKAGELITYDKIVEPKESVLWDLRQKQDEYFLTDK